MVCAGAAGAQEVPKGVWMLQNGKAAVSFHPCGKKGEELCGTLVWGRKDQYPDGQTKDVRNPDPKLRGRELCGAEVVWGLEWEGDGTWSGGRVYDPHSGKTYGARLEILGPERLKVRGYIGIPWIGKTQNWKPAPPDLEVCGG